MRFVKYVTFYCKQNSAKMLRIIRTAVFKCVVRDSHNSRGVLQNCHFRAFMHLQSAEDQTIFGLRLIRMCQPYFGSNTYHSSVTVNDQDKIADSHIASSDCPSFVLVDASLQSLLVEGVLFRNRKFVLGLASLVTEDRDKT